MIYAYFEMLKLTYSNRYFNIKIYMKANLMIGLTIRLEAKTNRFYLGDS